MTRPEGEASLYNNEIEMTDLILKKGRNVRFAPPSVGLRYCGSKVDGKSG